MRCLSSIAALTRISGYMARWNRFPEHKNGGDGYYPRSEHPAADMKKQGLIFLFFFLVLYGCSSTSQLQNLDPLTLRSTAQAAEALANQLERKAKATERAQAVQSTRQAQAITATAIAFDAHATQQASNITATAQAGEAQAQATAQALSNLATATAQALSIALNQDKATATAQAAAELEKAQTARREREEIAAEARLYAGIVLLGGLVLLTLGLIWYAGRYYLDVLIQRLRLVESRAGTLLLQPEGLRPTQVIVITPQLSAGSGPETDEFTSDLEDIPYIVNGKLHGFISRRDMQANDDPHRKLALHLLRDAMRQVGGDSRRLPGWREMSWSAESWMRAVDLLRPFVETQSGRGGGTYLTGQYSTLRDLYLAIGERRITLSPAPIEMV